MSLLSHKLSYYNIVGHIWSQVTKIMESKSLR